MKRLIRWKCKHGVSNASLQDEDFNWMVTKGLVSVPSEPTMNNLILQYAQECRTEFCRSNIQGCKFGCGGGLKFVKLGQLWKIIAHSRALEQGS